MAAARNKPNVLPLVRHFFPQISPNGDCYGRSHMAIPALILSDLEAFNTRLTEIYYEKELSAECKDFIEKHHLRAETKSEIKETKQPNLEMLDDDPRKVAYLELRKETSSDRLNIPDLKTWVTTPREDSLVELSDLPLRTPESLQSYLDLAEKTNRKARELKIPEIFPEAKQIETFFSGVALYQSTGDFRYLFDDENIPASQDAEKVAAIIGNFKSVVEIERTTHLYSFSMLQNFFEQVAKALTGKNLPFALSVLIPRHMFVIGMMNEKFILIEVSDPYPRAIAQQDIALEVFKTCVTSKLSAHSENFIANFGFDPVKKKIFFISCHQKNSLNLDDIVLTEGDRITLASATTNKIKKLTDMNFVMHLKWYTHTSTLKPMQELYRRLQESDEFKSIYQIPSACLTASEDHPQELSVFHLACRAGDLKKIQQLIEMGFNVNQLGMQAEIMNSPLKMSCEVGAVKNVELLLEHKADPNIADVNGVTPLIVAIENGQIVLVRILLRAGADVNAVMKDVDQTPLSTAVYYGFAKIADLLLQSGAKIASSRKILQEQTIGSGFVMPSLEPVVTQAHQTGTLHLLLAAERGHSAVVDVLIKHAADVNLALFLAVKFNLINATRMLRGDLLDHLDIKKSILYQRCESWDKKRFLEEYHAAYIRQLSAGTSKLKFFSRANDDCMLEFDSRFFQCTKAC